MLDFGDTTPFTAQHAASDPAVVVAQPSVGSPSPYGEEVALSGRMIGFTVGNSIDNTTGTATVTFERGLGQESLSPLNEDGLRYGNGRPVLDPHCALRLITSLGGANVTFFNGRIDAVDAAAGDNQVTVTCRDFGGYLLNAVIPQVSLRGDGVTDAETIMAGLLTDYDPNLNGFTTPFRVPTPSGFVIYETPIGEISVLEAMRLIAQQIGWDVRWFMSGSDPLGQLRFYDPARVRAILDWTFDVGQYTRLTELSIDDADVRNSWDVYYRDPTTGLPVGPIHVEDSVSMARYGTRPATIYLNRAENIRSNGAATTFGNAALADSKDPLVSHVIELPFFPPVELNDWVRFLNYDEYNGGINLAVSGYTHTWNDKAQTTTIQGRAAPIAAYRDYRRSIPPKTIVTTVAPTTQYAPEGTVIYVKAAA